jgi:HlyD family secretion protein
VWKWILIILVILAGSCAGSGWYLQSSGKLTELMQMMRPESKPKVVRVGTAARDDLVRTISAPGQVEPKTKVEISAQVSARIIALPFRENDQVKKGDVLVRLDARDLAALLDSAKAQLKSEEARLEGARAGMENALTERNRRQKLAQSGDISKAELDQFETDFRRSESALRVGEHAIEIARANITRAEKDLDSTTITAPFDGVITKLNAEQGELVVVGTLNSPGSVIMEVADLDVMLLKARIDEANIASVKEGQKAKVFVNAFSDRPIVGTVDIVGLKREVDKDGTAYFLTEILLDRPDGMLLRSGMTANADIEVETFRGIVKVPSQAVQDRVREELPAAVVDSSPFIDKTKKFTRVVYVVADGKTRVVPVTVGASDLTDTVITGGLEEGAKIVVGPFKSLIALRHDQDVTEEGAQEVKPGQAQPKTVEASADKKAEKPAAHGGT